MIEKDMILTGKSPVLNDKVEKDSLNIGFLDGTDKEVKRMLPLSGRYK